MQKISCIALGRALKACHCKTCKRRRLLLLQLLREITRFRDSLLLNRGNCLLLRSFKIPSGTNPAPFDVLNLSNDFGDHSPLNQARKERCRIGQNLPASCKQCSDRRLGNSAQKFGSGFRLRDEILGGFPIFRNVRIATHFLLWVKRNLSILRIVRCCAYSLLR